MKDSIILTKEQVRKIILHSAGLARKMQFGTGIDALYRVIDHLGFLQLDTNYVVERAHHHAIFSRIPDYQTQWLAELVEEGLIFEYFFSDSCYLPMHDFRYSLPVKERFANGKSLTPAESRLMSGVLDRVEREGPLTVGDFDDDRIEASTGWWDWRPAKVALERLYFEGKLMVTRNRTFKKSYDLPLNLVPAETDQSMPSPEGFARYIIRRTLGGLGVAYAKEIAWRARRVKGNVVKKVLEEMVVNGELRSVAVDGLTTALLYMLNDQATDIEISGDVFILSPFDVLNVFRHRLKDFFDFDYQIECFVPAPKRKYGYFSLPVLAGDVFIARMDAKADRKQKMLIVHNLYFENVNLNDQLIGKFVEALKDFVLFNQCQDVRFIKTNNETYMDKIREML